MGAVIAGAGLDAVGIGCGGAAMLGPEGMGAATGKGSGKNEDVNLVCTNCGDDAVFICATKPGSDTKHDHAPHGK